MKPIEAYPDKKHCEMCGALVTKDGADSLLPDHTAVEVIRRLAFIAEDAPSLAILLIYHIAGKTEQEIATKLKVTQQAVHSRLQRTQKRMLLFSKPQTLTKSILNSTF